MIAVLVSEARKFFSTRLWWILLLSGMGYTGLMAGGMSFLEGQFGDGTGGDAGFIRLIYSLGSSFGYVFPALVGALAVTTEYRHKTLTPTFLAEPHRGKVLVGKLIAAIPMGAAFGVAITGICVGLGGGVSALLGKPTGLELADTWLLIARCVLTLTLWCVAGVGLGTIIPSQVASIVVLLVFTQFIEPVLRMIPAFTQKALPPLSYLPGAVGDAIAGESLFAQMSAGPDSFVPLGLGLAVVVLLAYGLVMSGIGYLTQLRRDIS